MTAKSAGRFSENNLRQRQKEAGGAAIKKSRVSIHTRSGRADFSKYKFHGVTHTICQSAKSVFSPRLKRDAQLKQPAAPRYRPFSLPPPLFFYIFFIFFSFSFFIFSHYKFSAPDSSRPRALFDPSRHPLQPAIDAFHPRDKRAYVRGCVDVFESEPWLRSRWCEVGMTVAGSDAR